MFESSFAFKTGYVWLLKAHVLVCIIVSHASCEASSCAIFMCYTCAELALTCQEARKIAGEFLKQLWATRSNGRRQMIGAFRVRGVEVYQMVTEPVLGTHFSVKSLEVNHKAVHYVLPIWCYRSDVPHVINIKLILVMLSTFCTYLATLTLVKFEPTKFIVVSVIYLF